MGITQAPHVGLQAHMEYRGAGDREEKPLCSSQGASPCLFNLRDCSALIAAFLCLTRIQHTESCCSKTQQLEHNTAWVDDCS